MTALTALAGTRQFGALTLDCRDSLLARRTTSMRAVCHSWHHSEEQMLSLHTAAMSMLSAQTVQIAHCQDYCIGFQTAACPHMQLLPCVLAYQQAEHGMIVRRFKPSRPGWQNGTMLSSASSLHVASQPALCNVCYGAGMGGVLWLLRLGCICRPLVFVPGGRPRWVPAHTACAESSLPWCCGSQRGLV